MAGYRKSDSLSLALQRDNALPIHSEFVLSNCTRLVIANSNRRGFRVRAGVQDARPDPHEGTDRGPAGGTLVGSGTGISKPEMEWIATTLRAVLGVPATDAPTGDAIRAGSDEPRGRRRPR